MVHTKLRIRTFRIAHALRSTSDRQKSECRRTETISAPHAEMPWPPEYGPGTCDLLAWETGRLSRTRALSRPACDPARSRGPMLTRERRRTHAPLHLRGDGWSKAHGRNHCRRLAHTGCCGRLRRWRRGLVDNWLGENLHFLTAMGRLMN